MDVYLRLAGKYDIKAYNHSHNQWFDMGKYQQVLDFNENMEIGFLNNPL